MRTGPSGRPRPTRPTRNKPRHSLRPTGGNTARAGAVSQGPGVTAFSPHTGLVFGGGPSRVTSLTCGPRTGGDPGPGPGAAPLAGARASGAPRGPGLKPSDLTRDLPLAAALEQTWSEFQRSGTLRLGQARGVPCVT